MNKLRTSIAFAICTLMTAPALARKAGPTVDDATADRESREREARRACLEGDYATGVRLLSDLFLDTKNATYIFNQGRCYEQNERYAEAISRFREFMRTTDEDKDVAQKHIAECENLARSPVATIPLPAAAPAPVPPVAVATPVVARATSDGSGLRVAGAVLGGVGVAGIVTGVALNLKANSLANSIAPPNTYQRSTESTRKSYATASWVGYGLGAASLATGAILYAVGWSRASSPAVALAPTFGTDGAGVLAGGSF